MLKTLGRHIFDMIPADSSLLLRFSQRYIDRYFSDNNSDPSTNGEEQLLRSILPEICKRGKGVVFDVGANVGDWSKYCLGLTPSLNIHLFEPSKATFEKLQRNYWPPNAVLNNFGLGERIEQINLNIAADGSGMNSVYMRHGLKDVTMDSVERIETRTLDDYCKEHRITNIDLLKIDVEGHELAILKGAARMLKEKRIQNIQFEYGGCNLDARVYLLDIWNFLTYLDFQIWKLYPSGPRRVKQYDQSMETFKYSNWLAICSEIQ